MAGGLLKIAVGWPQKPEYPAIRYAAETPVKCHRRGSPGARYEEIEKMRVREVAQIIEDYAPLESGIPGDELGLLAGDPDAEVKGVGTCWSPTLKVLQQAVDNEINMLVCHEPLTYGMCGRDPEAHLVWFEERHPTAKVPNQKRMALVLEKGLSVYRYHSNWDFAPRYGIIDALSEVLELGEKSGGQRQAPLYTIPSTTVRALAERARRKLKLGPVRLIGDLERSITRVTVCVGGFGQMFSFPEVAVDGGAELAFFGEMLDYTIRYCVEVDLAAIELGHFQSEQPGMVAMADFLRSRLGQVVEVCTIPSAEPWSYFGQ